MTDTAVTVRKLLIENMGIDLAIITDDATLAGDLDLDSVELVEFALLLEDSMGIAIPDDAIKANFTVAEVCAAVEKLKGAV
jgi:acyl carrier protein